MNTHAAASFRRTFALFLVAAVALGTHFLTDARWALKKKKEKQNKKENARSGGVYF